MRNRHPIQEHSAFVAGVLLLLLGLGLVVGWVAASLNRQADTQLPDASTLDVSSLASPTSLNSHITYLRDPGGNLTLADVASPAYAERYQSARDGQNFGVTSDAVWVHFALTNPSSAVVPVVLHADAANTAYLDLYSGVPIPGKQPDFATGATRPYATRPIPGPTFAFPLAIPPGGTTDYYLRYESDLPIRITTDLWQPSAFEAERIQVEIWWGIVLGMLLIMSGYNLLLYIALHDEKHLLLAILGLLVAASSAIANGYASRWMPAELSSWSPFLTILSISAVISILAVVALSFLELRRHLRVAYWCLVSAIGVCVAAVVVAGFGRYVLAYSALIVLLLPLLLLIFAVTIIRVRQRSRMALFFLIGQFLPIVYGVVQSLSILGFGPRWPGLPFIVPINSLFLLVLMSLALADRINLLRREADQANAALLASEQRLSTYLDALPFSILVHDAKLKPLYVNAAIRQTSGDLPPGWFDEPYEVWVRGFPVSISGSDQPYPIEQLPLMRAARGETVHVDNVGMPGPQGQVTLEAWAVPLFDNQGQVSAIVSAFQDITARRAVETELLNYRETLEQRVEQRTSELAALNTSLGERVAELTAINEVGRRVARINDLATTLGDVAHVLAQVYRVPLASISLFDDVEHKVQMAALADSGSGVQAEFTGQWFRYDPAYGLPLQQFSPIIINSPAQLPGLPPYIYQWLAARGIQQVLVAPLVARDRIIGALALLVDDPARVFTADETRVAQTIAGQVATAIDTLELIAEVRQQRDVAEALRRTATALSRNLDQQNVLGTILEQLDQVFACEGAALALVEGRELVTVAAQGLSADCLGRRTALDGNAAGLTVLRTRRPSIVDDTGVSTERVCCTDSQPIRSWLGVPLMSGDTAIGVLSLDSTEVGAFTQARADLLASFAGQAAIAVLNARLYDQAQAAAVAGERTRLARDLHDAVTQTIFSASLIAASLPARLPELPPGAQADIETLQMLTKGALAEMRTLLLELRPERLAEVPVETLLAQLAQAFSGRTGVPATVNANCDPAFAPPYSVKIAFYRVAQEALNNAAKHARAACVTIRYSTRAASQVVRGDSVQAGSVRLAVIDDGRGFAPQSVGPERLGLTIMHERAAAVGAQLTVDSEPGLGTHVFMVWSNEDNTQTA